jgi:hypothetical protein
MGHCLIMEKADLGQRFLLFGWYLPFGNDLANDGNRIEVSLYCVVKAPLSA